MDLLTWIPRSFILIYLLWQLIKFLREKNNQKKIGKGTEGVLIVSADADIKGSVEKWTQQKAYTIYAIEGYDIPIAKFFHSVAMFCLHKEIRKSISFFRRNKVDDVYVFCKGPVYLSAIIANEYYNNIRLHWMHFENGKYVECGKQPEDANATNQTVVETV